MRGICKPHTHTHLHRGRRVVCSDGGRPVVVGFLSWCSHYFSKRGDIVCRVSDFSPFKQTNKSGVLVSPLSLVDNELDIF